MYKIQTTAGESFLTEKPNYVYVHRSGNAYVLCEPAKATGVMYKGTYYAYADGVSVYEFDGADEIRTINAEAQATAEHLAETDEIAIDLFEASLAQEAINAEQDEAIIEIYEMMEVATNG